MGGEILFESERLRAVAAIPEDAPELQRVFEAAGDYFVPITGHPAPDRDAAAREIGGSATVAGREVALLVRREDGEAVGALGWWERSPAPDLTLLGMILIVPSARGAGLAREVLLALERHLAARGTRRIRTGVGAHHEERKTLLRALGFSPLDERTHVSLDRGRMMIGLYEKAI